MTNRRLVLLHIHGLGPASVDYLEKLRKRVRSEVALRLRARGLEKLAGESCFVISTPRWDDIFNEPKDAWLKTAFPNEWQFTRGIRSLWSHSPLRRLAITSLLGFMLLSCGVALFLWQPDVARDSGFESLDRLIKAAKPLAWVVSALVAAFCAVFARSFLPNPLRRLLEIPPGGRGSVHLELFIDLLIATMAGVATYNLFARGEFPWGEPLVQWATGAVVSMLILVALVLGRDDALNKWVLRLVRWGDAFSLMRGFEAQSVSDLWIYSNEKHKERIFERILDTLKLDLRQAGVDGGSDELDGMTVILSGHSLGSVIAADLLRYFVDFKVAQSGPDGTRHTALHNTADFRRARRAFLSLLAQDSRFTRMRVVGMFTYGSPIALFLFRNLNKLVSTCSGLLDCSVLFRALCPPEFSGAPPAKDNEEAPTAETGCPGWRWLNFWHYNDFVAHRLEALLNPGGTPQFRQGKFVEDKGMNYASAGPISAHSGYFNQRVVWRHLGEHAAGWLECMARDCPEVIQPPVAPKPGLQDNEI